MPGKSKNDIPITPADDSLTLSSLNRRSMFRPIIKPRSWQTTEILCPPPVFCRSVLLSLSLDLNWDLSRGGCRNAYRSAKRFWRNLIDPVTPRESRSRAQTIQSVSATLNYQSLRKMVPCCRRVSPGIHQTFIAVGCSEIPAVALPRILKVVKSCALHPAGHRARGVSWL